MYIFGDIFIMVEIDIHKAKTRVSNTTVKFVYSSHVMRELYRRARVRLTFNQIFVNTYD